MPRLKNLLQGLWLRTLKIDILTLFITLTILTFSCVIGYSYVRNYTAILKYSKGMMERNSAIIVERIQNTEGDAEQILLNTSGLLIDNQNLSVHDPQLQRFLLDVLKLYPNTSSLFLAFESGNMIAVQTVSSSPETHFISDPSKLLPAGATYILQILDVKQQPNPEVWYYTDSSFNVLASEELPHPSIDVKTRPWFIGATQTKQLYWTDVYHFAPTNELGLTVSNPIYNKNNELICVMGTDIAFKGLSDFLQKQKIGKFGQVFLIDEEANFLVPNLKKLQETDVSPQVAQTAATHFIKTKDHNFSFKFQNQRYLAYISNLPHIFHQNWQLITIVPFSEFFDDLIKTQYHEILITLGILLFSILVIIYFSNRISKPIVTLAKEIDKITNLNLNSEKRVFSYIIEIRLMDTAVASLRAGIRAFSHYVPKEIVKKLLAQGQEISLHVEKKMLTIFFSDIKDFTTIAEMYPLNELMPLLNEYFNGLSTIVLNNNGTIDKYIGDSVMAFWGAPLSDPDHAISACKTALKCQVFVNKFNQKCREAGNPEFLTRFGISSGSVVVGNIGTLERMNYTVIGDAVNTAARLQVTDKIYHVNILISDEVYRQTKDQFLVRPLDTVEVKGKKAKIKIYELVALQGPDPEIGATLQQKQLCTLFTQAYQHYVEGNFAAAKQLFTEIHHQFPDDYPTQFYLKRLVNIQ